MEQNDPLISVIVPVYNVEKYVGRCLTSIINQSYTNLEIIVVNDGSTDNSLSVCEEFAAQDSRINLITQDNKGLSGARNTGLRHYTGEYVTFVDSDDWIHRNMIEYLYHVLIRNDSEMSLCGSLRVSDGIIQDKQYKELEETIYSPETFMSLFLSERFTACWSRLFRRDVISGFEFPEGLNCEDYIYMYEAIRRIQKRVTFVDIPLYYYYCNRPDSIVNDSFGIKKFDQYYSAKRLFDLVCEYTPQYKKQSLTRLAGAIVSLVNSARQHKRFEDQEREMISALRSNAPIFLFNKYIKWKLRVLLFFLILPRKVSLICMRCVKFLAYQS
jgi:glycosyltransferase involved in cell wall biosynthesis